MSKKEKKQVTGKQILGLILVMAVMGQIAALVVTQNTPPKSGRESLTPTQRAVLDGAIRGQGMTREELLEEAKRVRDELELRKEKP